MDDVPAGPASPGPRRPSLSVVIPVRNGGRDFEHCLRRLRDSLLTDYELIVVDDGSTDGSAALAVGPGRSSCAIPTPHGPAAARNLGAQAATAPLDLLPRRRRRRPSRDPGPGHGPVRGRPGPRGPLRLVRRHAGRPGTRQPVPQLAPSLRPPAGHLSPGESGRPIRSGPAAGRSAATSSSTSAGSTPGSIPARPSRTSSSVIA